MNTKPIAEADRRDAACEIERVDDDQNYRTYLCCNPASHIWQATPDITIRVCRKCREWFLTMESLGLPLV